MTVWCHKDSTPLFERWWLLINWTFGNKFQLIFNQKIKMFIQVNLINLKMSAKWQPFYLCLSAKRGRYLFWWHSHLLWWHWLRKLRKLTPEHNRYLCRWPSCDDQPWWTQTTLASVTKNTTDFRFISLAVFKPTDEDLMKMLLFFVNLPLWDTI